MERGWRDIGYHFVIRRDGTIESGRPLERTGAHVKGHNKDSIGICMEGGLNDKGKPKNNFIDKQFNSLKLLIDGFKFQFNINIENIKGHRDYSPDKNKDGVITKNEWLKECPCFDVQRWYYGTGSTEEAKTGKSEMEEQEKDGMGELSNIGDSNNNSASKPGRKRRNKK